MDSKVTLSSFFLMSLIRRQARLTSVKCSDYLEESRSHSVTRELDTLGTMFWENKLVLYQKQHGDLGRLLSKGGL